MRILMVIDCYIPIWGGAQSALRRLNPYLTSLGCEISILTRRFEENMKTEEMIDNIPVYRVGWPGNNFFATVSYLLGLFFFTITHRDRFDIIHTQGAAALGAYGKLLAIITNKCNVARVSSSSRIPKLQKNLFGKFILMIFKKSNAIICLSDEIFQQLKNIHTPDNNIVRLSNAVDTNLFCPLEKNLKQQWKRKRGFAENDPVVIFSGRLVKSKRLDVLLNAWAKVNHVHSEARLLFLGNGKYHANSSEEELYRIVKNNSLGNVYFVGESNHPERYLAAADIFVFPVEYEGLSNALLEAMASGLGIIASDIDANREIIQHEKTGLLVPIDPSFLADAIIALIENIPKRELLGLEAREYVRRHHTFESVAKRYLSTYQFLMLDKLARRRYGRTHGSRML